MKSFILSYEGVEHQGYFEKAEKPQAAIAVIHGVGEHFGRYGRIARYLAERGCSVYGVDLPGHGKSPGIRGQIGKREDVYGLIDELISYMAREEPEVPLFLMGHSMGGNLVLSYRLAREESKLKAYIVSSPWIRLVDFPTFLSRIFSVIASIIVPNLPLDNRIKQEKLYTPAREPLEGAKPDHLYHHFITPSTAAGCFKWAKLVLKNAAVKRKPVYLIHGSKDEICAVEGSRQFAAAAGEQCTYREWEGLKHELLNEECWTDVADELLDWIRMQL